MSTKQDIQAAVVTTIRDEYDAKLRAALAADPEYQALRKAWLAARQEDSYSGAEFGAMDNRRYLVAETMVAAEAAAQQWPITRK